MENTKEGEQGREGEFLPSPRSPAACSLAAARPSGPGAGPGTRTAPQTGADAAPEAPPSTS